jgi:hypothetical protein
MEPPAPAPQQTWQQQQEEMMADDALEPGPPAEPPLAGENVMNIVMVGAECAPWSKTGGLGDVMGALPKAFARRGHRVMVVAPRYEIYDDAWETGIRRIFRVMNQDVEVSSGRQGWLPVQLFCCSTLAQSIMLRRVAAHSALLLAARAQNQQRSWHSECCRKQWHSV